MIGGTTTCSMIYLLIATLKATVECRTNLSHVCLRGLYESDFARLGEKKANKNTDDKYLLCSNYHKLFTHPGGSFAGGQSLNPHRGL